MVICPDRFSALDTGSSCWIHTVLYIHISLYWAQVNRALHSYSQGHFRLLSLVVSSCSCLSACAVSPSFKNINITSWKEQTVFFFSASESNSRLMVDQSMSLLVLFCTVALFAFKQRVWRGREVGTRRRARGGWWEGGGWRGWCRGFSRDVPAGSSLSLSLWLLRMTHEI